VILKPKKTLVLKAIGFVILTTCLAYLVQLLLDNREEVSLAVSSLTLGQALCSIAAALAMYLLKGYYHVLLIQRISKRNGLTGSVLPAYCVAQVVRYLPGKIWGMVYQVTQLSGTVSPGQVITANLIQMITTMTLGNLIIISILFAIHFNSLLPLTGIAIALILTEIIHRVPQIERKLLLIIAKITSREQSISLEIEPQRWVGTLILLLEWVAYFTIWAVVIGPSSDPIRFIELGTIYSAASVLAIVAIVAPSGIAVREALFVGLAVTTSANTALLLGYAVVLRLILTFAELLCVPVAMGLAVWLRRKSS